jgi:hypothetical protein
VAGQVGTAAVTEALEQFGVEVAVAEVFVASEAE